MIFEMIECPYAGTTGLYEHTYWGVFVSSFDYDMAVVEGELQVFLESKRQLLKQNFSAGAFNKFHR